MVMRVNDEMLAALYDGRCTVYVSEPEPADTGWASVRARRELYRDLPCHLAFERAAAASASGMSEVKAVCRLFLGAAYQIPPGSELVVAQQGHEYRLALTGLPCVYAVHQEITAALLEELA